MINLYAETRSAYSDNVPELRAQRQPFTLYQQLLHFR